MMHRKSLHGPLDSSKDCRLIDDSGEDLGRVDERGRIVYPGEVALKLIQGVKGLRVTARALAKAQKELREHRVRSVDLKPLDLRPLSRYPDRVFTHVRIEDSGLQDAFTETREGRAYGHNWLEFGESSITLNDRTGEALLGAYMRNGITDFEHDSCYIVWIQLVGLRWTMTSFNTSYFTAFITPNPKDIRIHDPSFEPEKVEGAYQCTGCENHHWVLPDGLFTPDRSDMCRLVAGKRISIITGPNWQDDKR